METLTAIHKQSFVGIRNAEKINLILKVLVYVKSLMPQTQCYKSYMSKSIMMMTNLCNYALKMKRNNCNGCQEHMLTPKIVRSYASSTGHRVGSVQRSLDMGKRLMRR